jgi:hypothetical protein
MRTTFNVTDDVLRQVKVYAESRAMGLGEAATHLMRRGLTANANVETRLVNGIHVVVLPADSPKISSERVKQLLEDEL